MSLVLPLSQTPRPIAIGTFKAFGDFVIAHSVASAVREHRDCVRILAGSHLDALAEVVAPGVAITRVPVRGDLLPPLFDARSQGLAAALRSGLELGRALTRVERRPNETLVFDRACWRSRWIARSWSVVGVYGSAPNIYSSFARELEKWGFPVSLNSAPHPLTGRCVGIFPGSRVPDKAIPSNVLRVVMHAIESAGFTPEIIRIDGEPPLDGVPFKSIPRTFRHLLDAVKEVDAVVSADSLPAHLGEYVGRRVFVVSRTPNPYWLPHGCFTNGYGGLFAARDLEPGLCRFLGGPSTGEESLE